MKWPRSSRWSTASKPWNCSTFPEIVCHFTQEIIVYEVSGEGVFALHGHFFPRWQGGRKSPPPNDPWDLLKTRFFITDQSLPSFTSQKKVHKRTNQKHLQGLKHLGPNIPVRKSFLSLRELHQRRPLLGRERRQEAWNTYPLGAVCAATEAKGSLQATVLMVITQKAALCSSSRAVTSTVAPKVTQNATCSLTQKKEGASPGRRHISGL